MDESSKTIIRKQTKVIVLLFFIILLLIVSLVIINFRTRESSSICGVKSEPEWVCGTDNLQRQTLLNNIPKAIAQTQIHGNYERGEKLFKQNCAVCHTTTDQLITGPGLKNIFNRVPTHQVTWLKNYILNYEKVKRSKDAYALSLSKKYDQLAMTIFEDLLSNEEVEDIIFYLAVF